MTDFRTEIQDSDALEASRQSSLQDSRPPSDLEGFTFIRKLGTGAYGSVWLAREDRTGRMVAVKYYPHRRGLNWSLMNREVEKLAALYASRNIVRLLDVGWNADPPYYIMEYVESGSLGGQLAAGSVPVSEAVRITREVCGALIEAHGAGVLHCDLKPDNVLLDAQGHVRLCDFGQSRMSHEHTPALGTLYYMAPEQASLDAVPDARWDVYAVGAMLYHMLTGAPPYRSAELQQQLESAESLDNRLQIYRSTIDQAARPDGHRHVTGVDNRLASLIDHCLAPSPQHRLPNAQAVLDSLEAREQQRARRPLLLLGLLGPVMLLIATVLIFLNALRTNIETMEKRITARSLESGALSARIQAARLRDELRDRLAALERAVSNPATRTVLLEILKRDPQEVAAELRAAHDSPQDAGAPNTDRQNPKQPDWAVQLDAERSGADDGLDTSWFLTDVTGIQIWRNQFSDTVGNNYAWRDYFHGGDRQYPPDEVPADIRPISGPHVSLPFRSEATGQYMVALSVPVFSSADPQEVIGVFARTAHLGDLQRRLGRQIEGGTGDRVPRVIALADARSGQMLDHPGMTSALLQGDPDSIGSRYRELRMDAEVLQAVQRTRGTDSQPTAADQDTPISDEVLVDRYSDPLDGFSESDSSVAPHGWMAAIASVPDSDVPWLVIVQENREAALAPVRDMESQARLHAWVAVIAGVAMMAVLWAVVFRAISRQR